jgi:hypothetical protein
MPLVVPARLANDARALRHPLVSEQSNHGEQSQQRGSGPPGIALYDQCLCVSNPRR